MRSDWTVKAALRTGKGRVRGNNEDNYYLCGLFSPLEEMNEEKRLSVQLTDEEALLFAVFDGMGGEENGEVASFTAASCADELAQQLKRQGSAAFHNAIQSWSSRASESVRAAAMDGGCTAVLLCMDRGVIRTAHLGDSRIYRLHRDQLVCLTRDHSKMQMLIDAGLLTEEQAKVHPHRHMITRFLGMDEEQSGLCAASVGRMLPAENGDRYLLCSDGVTDMIGDAALERLMSRAATAEECADSIYEAALNAGGRDNTTAMVLELSGTAAAGQPDDEDRGAASPDDEWLDITETPEGIPVRGSARTQPVQIRQQVTACRHGGFRIVAEISGMEQLPAGTFSVLTKTELDY